MYCALCLYYYYISSTSDHQALDLRGWGPWSMGLPCLPILVGESSEVGWFQNQNKRHFVSSQDISRGPHQNISPLPLPPTHSPGWVTSDHFIPQTGATKERCQIRCKNMQPCNQEEGGLFYSRESEVRARSWSHDPGGGGGMEELVQDYFCLTPCLFR